MSKQQGSPPAFTEYKKLPQQLHLEETSPTSPALSSGQSLDSNRQSLVFAKAAFAFRDGLEHSRHKSESQYTATTVSVPDTPVVEPPAPDTEDPELAAHEARHKKRIRILRSLQHLLTSLLSLIIAVLQGRTYDIYMQTKDVNEAWPTHPNVFPTLLLFTTALLSLFFDACAITAYSWPNTRIGQKAYRAAVKAHYITTSIKAVSYSITSIVCRAGFNQGNATNQNNDLWGWSCSTKADAMKHVNQCSFNCTGNTVAWIFAIINIAIEIIGVIIDQLVANDKRKEAAKIMVASSDEKKVETDPYSDAKPLLSKPKTDDSKLENLDTLGDELDAGLAEQTPDWKKDDKSGK